MKMNVVGPKKKKPGEVVEIEISKGIDLGDTV